MRCGVAFPLYRLNYEDKLTNLKDGERQYIVGLMADKPAAYAIDFGPEVGTCPLFNAEFVEERFEFLGDYE